MIVNGLIKPSWSDSNFASGENASETINMLSALNTGIGVYLINVYSQINSDRYPKLAKIYSSGVCFSDGLPLTKLLQKKDAQIKQIRGVDLMKVILSQGKSQKRHFFLGTTQLNLDRILERISRDFPFASIAGTFSPPFSDNWQEYLDECINLIKESHANVVWVGMGSPKQDYIVSEIVSRLNVVAIGVGAAFNYFSEIFSESPQFLKKIGMEWLYRWFKEPKRLTKRYVYSNTLFLLHYSKYYLKFPFSNQ